ncbi:MAG TPA: YcnI family protein [Microbacteriaceae bacterium]
MKKITIIRTVTTLGVASALALAAPLAASAHVRVTPDQAAAGSYAVLTFRVPTESATASTVKLEVDFPTTTPFSTVSYQPITGWQAVVTTVKLATPVKTATATITEAVTKVVWTADAASAIAPGQFQQFSVSAGPVPDTGSVMLPAQQTYSDGTVVNWDQPTPASGTEPQHPAPTLYINDAPPSASGPATVPTVSATPSADPAGGASGSSASNDAQSAGVWVGLGGLALGAIALVVAVLALTRQGRFAQRAAGASERGGTSPRNDTSGDA